MNESDMNEITRFERLPETVSPPRMISPPPIAPEAMAAVAKANQLARSVSNELPLEWPQPRTTSKALLMFAVITVVTLAGGLGYYIFSEGQAVLEQSRKSAEYSDAVSTQSAAAVREGTDRAPLPPPIPPTAPIRMGQWIPDATSQGQGQPGQNYVNPSAVAPAPVQQLAQPMAATYPQQAQLQAQAQAQIQMAQAQAQAMGQPYTAAPPPAPQAQIQAPVPPPAPLTLAQTAPQLNTQSITITSAAPAPAPAAPQPQPLTQTAPLPQPAGAAPAPAPAPAPKTALVGPQAPRAADPKAIEASIADEPAQGTPQPTPLVLKVRTKEARFHSGPGVQYPIIAVARAETRYAVADWSDRWFKVAIRLPSGTTMGWIRNDQVLITPGGASEKLPTFGESASNEASDEESE